MSIEPAEQVESNSRPAYRELAETLKRQILANEYPAGVQLPTELDLAKTHRLSRQTVRRAYQELVNQGLVTRSRGKGSFPAQPGGLWLFSHSSIDEMTAVARDTELQVVEPLKLTQNSALAQDLGLHLDDVWAASVLRTSHGVAVMTSRVAVPPDIGIRLEAIGALSRAERLGVGQSTVKFVQSVHDHKIIGAQQRITAIAADAERARLLRSTVGSPLLRIEHTYFDSQGRAVQLAVSDFDPREFQWTMRLREVAG